MLFQLHTNLLNNSVRNATALEALVAPEERASFPLVWRGEWVPFMCTYMVREERDACDLFSIASLEMLNCVCEQTELTSLHAPTLPVITGGGPAAIPEAGRPSHTPWQAPAQLRLHSQHEGCVIFVIELRI